MTQPDAPVNGIHAGIAAVINEIDVAVYRFAAGGPQADGVVSRDAPIGSGGQRCRATSPWANSPLISRWAVSFAARSSDSARLRSRADLIWSTDRF